MLIYKYKVDPGPCKCLSYSNFKVLSTGLDPAGELCVWIAVDTLSGPKQIEFLVLGTGWAIPADRDLVFIGTVKQGPYMWHVFQDIGGE